MNRIPPLIAPLDAVSTPFLTPLHAGCPGLGGSNCETQNFAGAEPPTGAPARAGAPRTGQSEGWGRSIVPIGNNDRGRVPAIDPDRLSTFSFVEFVDTLKIGDAAVVLLLHCNRDVCVPGDVYLVANLNLIEHGGIDDTSTVFPSVRTGEGDR